MNEWDIDHRVYLTNPTSLEGRAARALQRFQQLVDRNSDGWAYWVPARRAAVRLIQLLDSPEISEAAFRKAMTPIKSFCKRRKLRYSEVEDNQQVLAV